MGSQHTTDPSATALLDLVAAHRITAVIYVAARLGVADLLAEGPKTSGKLAQQTGTDERSLRRLLRALVSLGVCKQIGTDQFDVTAIGAYLAGGAKQSLKAWTIFEGALLYGSHWGGLLESIRTGKTAAELAGFDNPFEMMAQNSAGVRIFNDAMVANTRLLIPAVLSAYDFSPITRLFDVGGGYGELLCAILKAHPSMRGAIFDLPRCAEGAKQQLAEAGVSERGEFISGNFFESVPSGADALVLKSVIHDWNDERSVKILENCRRALPTGGRLLLVERLMPEMPEANAEHRSVTLSDLNMLRGPGGCERTESEYRDLFRRSGFKMTRVLPAAPSNVIEATIT